MRRLTIPVVLLAAALILAVSFFLPTYISVLRDRQSLDILSVAEGMSAGFQTSSKLTMPDRLSLINSAGNMELANGKNLDSETAYQRALDELRSFNSSGFMAFDFNSWQLLKCGVSFYIDSENPSKNLIVWYIVIEDTLSHSIEALVDDETGKLLSVGYVIAVPAKPSRGDEIATVKTGGLAVEPDALVEAITSYYGLETTASPYTKTESGLGIELMMRDGASSVVTDVYIRVNGFWF